MAEQNQAGTSSAVPETQQGLQETILQPKEILKGARQEDQLQQLKDNAKPNEEPTIKP